MGGSRRSVSHHCEVVIHTGVPASVSLYTVTGVIISDVIALTCRANESTCAAAEAAFAELFPIFAFKAFAYGLFAPAVKTERSKRKLFKLFGNLIFDFVCAFVAALTKDGGKRFCKFFTLFGVCFPVKGFAVAPCCYVSAGSGSVNAENGAEASLFRL